MIAWFTTMRSTRTQFLDGGDSVGSLGDGERPEDDEPRLPEPMHVGLYEVADPGDADELVDAAPQRLLVDGPQRRGAHSGEHGVHLLPEELDQEAGASR